MRWWHALGLGLRTIGGGGGAAVSKVIEERERARGQKFAKCGERESMGDLMQDVPLVRMSPFS
jgi:hypothetical protein